MLLCMTACQKEENNGILRLEIEHFSSDTKLHLDAAHFAVWDNNDEVLLNDVRKPVTISNGTATISGVATADNYTAVYPSSWTTSTSSITYPEFQFNFDGRVIAPMAATYSDGKLKFKNLGAILAVNVSTAMTVDRIEVIADGTTSISGTFPISYTGERPTIGTPTAANLKNMTTLICDTVVPNTGMTFYIALPPVTAKLTIKVYSGDNTCYTTSQTNPFAMQANHGYSVSWDNFASTGSPLSGNQIIYTAPSKIGNTYLRSAFSSNVSTHEYDETTGQGIVTFAGTITQIMGTSFKSSYLPNNITSITLPASVTIIRNYAFKGCTNLTSVVIPGTATIGSNAFNGCTSLSAISMPNVTTISSNAFDGCTSLSAISMPNVTSIDDRAFFNCTKITDVYCTRTSAPTLGTQLFYNVPNAAKLHLPLSGYSTLTWGSSYWPGQTYWDL